MSPNGATVVYSARDRDDLSYGRRRLYRHDLDALESVPIRGTEGGQRPFISPDGASVGFFTGSDLRRVPLSGGISVPLADTVEPSAGTWLDDGSIVFGLVPQQNQRDVSGLGLYRVSASGDERSAVVPFRENGEEALHFYPAAVPGGRGFVSTGQAGSSYWVYLHSPGSSWVYLHSPGSSEPIPLMRGRRARVSPTGHLVFEQDGSLWAIGFDVEHATVTGEAVPVVESFGPAVSAASRFDVATFDVSANGTLAYAKAATVDWADRSLFWVDRNGREEPLEITPRPYWFPQASPLGDRIGFHIMDAENMDAHAYDLTSGVTDRLTLNPRGDGYPLWTPEGDRVVFWSYRGSDANAMNLFIKPADGTGGVDRLTDSPNNQVPFSWADEGRLLVFTERHPETSFDIWTIPIDGDRTPAAVLREPHAESRPAISPDGRWIAYQSNQSGQWQIVVHPFPDVENGTWIIGDGMSPKWSPNGAELYYRAENAMMAVPIDTTDGSNGRGPLNACSRVRM